MSRSTLADELFRVLKKPTLFREHVVPLKTPLWWQADSATQFFLSPLCHLCVWKEQTWPFRRWPSASPLAPLWFECRSLSWIPGAQPQRSLFSCQTASFHPSHVSPSLHVSHSLLHLVLKKYTHICGLEYKILTVSWSQLPLDYCKRFQLFLKEDVFRIQKCLGLSVVVHTPCLEYETTLKLPAVWLGFNGIWMENPLVTHKCSWINVFRHCGCFQI